MAEYKTYEYIWLDGNKPESSMRSKVKATDADTHLRIGLLMAHPLVRLKAVVQIAY